MASQKSSEIQYETILTEFNRQVEITPDKVAVLENHPLTYRDLQIQSRRLSSHLPLDQNPIVAILLPGGSDFILSLLTILNSSKAYSPLSVDYPAVKLESMLQSIGNPLLITNKSTIKVVGLAYQNTYFLNLENEIMERSAVKTQIPLLAEDTGAIYFTSGSTGEPKACMVGSRAAVRMAKTGVDRMKICEQDESVCILNPAFVLSIYDIFMSLFSGATIHFPPNAYRYDIPKLREWVKSKGTITTIFMVSSIGEAFFTAEPDNFPPSLRVLMMAGEKLQSRPSDILPFAVHIFYGSTETLTISSSIVGPVSPLKDPVAHSLVGQHFPGVDIYILDEVTKKPVAIGETGEVAIGGPCVSMGYMGGLSSNESNQKFIYLENGVKVFRMGDLGYLMPDGNLVVLNRRDNQIKVSGYRFDLSDLESALLQHNSVEKAVAVLEKCKKLRFHLFYSLKSSTNLSENEINEFLKDRLPHYAFPHSITRVDQFPRNAHGKLDKAALLLLKVNQKIIEPTETETEKLLVKVWSEILGIPCSEIGRNDNFFAIGGSSLTASKVVSNLAQLSQSVQVFNIFKLPVLKDLAKFLDGATVNHVLDFDQEVNSLRLNFASLRSADPYNYGERPKSILITGATGYLGSSLLVELLANTEASIYCLIRSSNTREARVKLEDRLKISKMVLKAEDLQRVHFIPADLSVPHFGLSQVEYDSLAEAIDQIYHCAAEVHWLKRYEELRTVNVQGTFEIINFASTKKLKFLHYISTIGVFGATCETKCLEIRNIARNVEDEMGYVQSKWVAEKLVWKAIGAGLPGIVYRPGIIGSHSVLNVFNSNDFITHLFKTCQFVGAFPDIPWKFPYGTLDFTVKSIIAISQNLEENCGGAFHTFQNILLFEEFYECFQNHNLRKVSNSNWKDMVSAVASDTGPSSNISSVKMIKLFLFVPFYKNFTFFELPSSKYESNISNYETIKVLEVVLPKCEFLEKKVQIMNFGDSVFQQEA